VGLTASEGYFAIPLHSTWRGGVAWVGGHLLELKSESGEICPIYEAEIGRIYRLVVSTTAGLYRYDMNDLVSIEGYYDHAPILQFVGKGEDVSSVVGEKVTAAQISAVLSEVLPDSYAGDVCTSLEMGEIPRYRICVEGDVSELWAQSFDEVMKKMNVEYASKRESGRLGGPKVFAMPVGTLAGVRNEKTRKGAADGQVKDPMIVPHEDVLEWIMRNSKR